jgi:NADH:ubiquinone oxidoreductase subunit K
MLNAVNLNLVAFAAKLGNVAGQVFALFVITIAAAEVGVGLAIVLLIYRNRVGVNLDEIDLMKG